MSERLPPIVAEACWILFGVAPDEAPAMVAQLRPDQLKATFRRRALEFHPDRAATLRIDRHVLEQRFKVVQQAFDLLERYIATRSELARCRKDRQPPAGYWEGAVPERSLKLGEYLYFSRWLPWPKVAAALTVQQQRPLWGAIAIHLGLLSRVEVEQLELRRLSSERLGDAAVRLGKLTSRQCERIIVEQRRHAPPIGELLVRRGDLDRHELDHVLDRYRAHNATCADPFARWAA